jgi:hypothetical protein
MPLWVTEWTCQNYVSSSVCHYPFKSPLLIQHKQNDVNAQCSPAEISAFMNQTQSFMDETDYVERYAWYGAMENLGGVNPVRKALSNFL